LPGNPISQASCIVDDAIHTPCIGVCTLGPGNYCVGCLRTAEEIGNWLNYSAEDREQIVSELPKRLDLLFES
jgi:predicted Fe-S protein YdhL (DUF1289 family)